MNRLHSSRLILFGLIVLALTFTSIPQAVVEAAAGDLDPTFGTNGATFDPQSDEAFGAALQADGKLITAGVSRFFINDPFKDFLVERFTKDGVLDPTFGAGGRVRTDINGNQDVALAVAVQRDGRIVVAGFTVARTLEFSIVRYNPDGSLDPTFGSGGKVVSNSGILHDLTSLAVQGDDKIVLAGTFIINNRLQIGVFRFNPNGSPDSSFGSGGQVFTLISTRSLGRAMKLGRDGKIIVGGGATTPDDLEHYVVARYNPDGSLDPTFGSGGIVLGGTIGHVADILALAIQSDGKIVAAGDSFGASTGKDFTVIRYLDNGNVDSTFNGGIEVTIDFSGEDVVHDLVVQPDGKIVVGGSKAGGMGFALARLNGGGSLDASFGVGGKRTTEFSFGHSAIQALVLQSNKLIAAGLAQVSAGSMLAVARYDLGLPAYDLCVQDDGSGNLLQINTTTGEYQFSNCGGLTVGGTGMLTKRGSQISLQHNSADRRVTATIDTAIGRATASLQLLSQGRTFSITDRNINNNTCACR
jgi:uncharacterized delta-60 repeat protein